jgi:cell division protein FtsN
MSQNHRDPFDDYEDDDGSDYLTFDARDDEDGGRRGPIILAAIILLMAVFGAILWVYFVGGKQDDSEPPAIEASTQEYKEAQVNELPPITNEVGNSVYGASSGAEPAPLEVEAMAATEAPIVAANSVAAPAVTKTAPTTTTPPRPAVSAATPKPKPAVKAASVAPTAPTTTPKAAPKAATPAPATAPKAAAPSTAGNGSFSAQLASFPDRASADRAAASYRTYTSSPVEVTAANLGARGTWYRVRVVGLASRDVATSFCARVKASGDQCIPSN